MGGALLSAVYRRQVTAQVAEGNWKVNDGNLVVSPIYLLFAFGNLPGNQRYLS